MWFCSRSQGHPCGERKSAMIFKRSLIADFDFLNRIILKYYQIITVNDLSFRHLLCPNCVGSDGNDTSRKFCSIKVTNPHHFPRFERAFTTRNPRWQQTFTLLPERAASAFIHVEDPFGVMKESN